MQNDINSSRPAEKLSSSERVARKCRDIKLSPSGRVACKCARIKCFPLRGERHASAERGLRLEKLLMKAFPLGGENLSSDSNLEESGGAADG